MNICILFLKLIKYRLLHDFDVDNGKKSQFETGIFDKNQIWRAKKLKLEYLNKLSIYALNRQNNNEINNNLTVLNLKLKKDIK